MSHQVQFCLQASRDGTHKECSGLFNDNEWQSLEEYLASVERLSSLDLVREGTTVKYSVTFHKGGALSYSTELPPEVDVSALLHRLRPFVLHKEPTNFNTICSCLRRSITAREFCDIIKYLQRLYDGRKMQSAVLVTADGVKINSDKTLDEWLNAYEYHRDRDKRADFESLHEIFPLEASRAIFISMLLDRVEAIVALGDIISVVMERKASLGYTM
jgi:hypothetical protein